jgi:hypothetical protein
MIDDYCWYFKFRNGQNTALRIIELAQVLLEYFFKKKNWCQRAFCIDLKQLGPWSNEMAGAVFSERSANTHLPLDPEGPSWGTLLCSLVYFDWLSIYIETSFVPGVAANFFI